MSAIVQFFGSDRRSFEIFVMGALLLIGIAGTYAIGRSSSKIILAHTFIPGVATTTALAYMTQDFGHDGYYLLLMVVCAIYSAVLGLTTIVTGGLARKFLGGSFHCLVVIMMTIFVTNHMGDETVMLSFITVDTDALNAKMMESARLALVLTAISLIPKLVGNFRTRSSTRKAAVETQTA